MVATGKANRGTPSPTAVAIRSAAVQLFYERGFEATSQRQLADAVGLQVASLYNHIKNKEQLLAEIMKGAMHQLMASTKAALREVSSPEEQFVAFMSEGIRFHAEHRVEAFVGNTELRALSARNRRTVVELRNKYEKQLESILEDCVANGSVSVPDTRMAAYAGVAICVHVASWYRAEGELSLDQVIESLLAAYAPTSGLAER